MLDWRITPQVGSFPPLSRGEHPSVGQGFRVIKLKKSIVYFDEVWFQQQNSLQEKKIRNEMLKVSSFVVGGI